MFSLCQIPLLILSYLSYLLSYLHSANSDKVKSRSIFGLLSRPQATPGSSPRIPVPIHSPLPPLLGPDRNPPSMTTRLEPVSPHPTGPSQSTVASTRKETQGYPPRSPCPPPRSSPPHWTSPSPPPSTRLRPSRTQRAAPPSSSTAPPS